MMIYIFTKNIDLHFYGERGQVLSTLPAPLRRFTVSPTSEPLGCAHTFFSYTDFLPLLTVSKGSVSVSAVVGTRGAAAGWRGGCVGRCGWVGSSL